MENYKTLDLYEAALIMVLLDREPDHYEIWNRGSPGKEMGIVVFKDIPRLDGIRVVCDLDGEELSAPVLRDGSKKRNFVGTYIKLKNEILNRINKGEADGKEKECNGADRECAKEADSAGAVQHPA